MPDPPLDLVIKSVRVVRPRRPQVERLDLGVQDGRFARIGFPGVVDAHTHVGIYGPLAEDAVSKSRAAVSGGVTTMLTYVRTGQQGYTPFEGQELTGWVTATFLRGGLAWEDGRAVGPARGRYIRRPA